MWMGYTPRIIKTATSKKLLSQQDIPLMILEVKSLLPSEHTVDTGQTVGKWQL